MSTQVRTRERNQRILDAALSVFSTRGYRDAVVDDIAAAADTSKGGVYFHFPGKQAIFLALLDRSAGVFLSRVAAAVEAERDPVAKVDAALLAVLRLFGTHRALARLFMVEAMGAGAEFHQKMTGIYDQFAGFIRLNLDEAVARGAIPPIDTRVASLVWFGAINQVVTRWAIDESAPPLLDTYPALRTLLLRSAGLAPGDFPPLEPHR